MLALLLSSSAVAAPQRIVSLDYCADQYVLALADKEQIAAVSRDAASERSNLPAAAAGLPQTPEGLENVLARHPDLVVRAWGGGYGLDSSLARLGVATVTLGFVDGFTAVRASLRQVGAAVGHPARAEAIIAQMDRRLANIAARVHLLPAERRPWAVYLTPNGATSGAQTLMHDVMTAAGLRNQGARGDVVGWRRLDLETLVMFPPDVVVASFFDLRFLDTDPWRVGRHSALQAFLDAHPVAYVPARKFACSTWFAVDAVEDIFRQFVAPRLMTAQEGGHP